MPQRPPPLPPSDSKERLGSMKPPLHLVPESANLQEAVVFGLGAAKYGGGFNWRDNQVRASTYLSAARRHLAQWFDGQDLDDESGVSHLAHARACLGILLDAEANACLLDDRPTPGAAARLIHELSKPAD